MHTLTQNLLKAPKWVLALTSIFCGSLFLGLLSQISIPLFFSPAMLSLQSVGVLLLGAVLGSKRGAASVLMYLGQGAMGLPVFAGGKAGALVLFGPLGGYYFGFVLAAFLVGFLFERASRSFWAFGAGSALILATGALWLGFWIGFPSALLVGVAPFLIGDLLKTLLLTSLFSRSKTIGTR